MTLFQKILCSGLVAIIGAGAMIFVGRIPVGFVHNTLGAIGFTVWLWGFKNTVVYSHRDEYSNQVK